MTFWSREEHETVFAGIGERGVDEGSMADF
jgi:hypothetical protein